MLHTLNKAYATIFIKQLINNPRLKYMFVCEDREEYDYYISLVKSLNEQQTINSSNLDVITVEDAYNRQLFEKNSEYTMPMYDDILITHSLHYKSEINNYLCQHCRRKGG